MNAPEWIGPVRPYTRSDADQGIDFARNLRQANKPWFDAIYGPEVRHRRCLACDGRGKLADVS